MLVDLDAGAQQFVGEPEAGAIRPVLRAVVGGEDAPGPAPLGVEAPVAVPAADVEHGLVPEVDGVELALNESPDAAVEVGVGRPGLRPQPVAEVEVVIPGNPVDP